MVITDPTLPMQLAGDAQQRSYSIHAISLKYTKIEEAKERLCLQAVINPVQQMKLFECYSQGHPTKI